MSVRLNISFYMIHKFNNNISASTVLEIMKIAYLKNVLLLANIFGILIVFKSCFA